MILLFIVLCLAVILKKTVYINGINEQYLSKSNTQAIKGMFIIIVFLSHIRTYAKFTNTADLFVIDILNYLGQLMVAMFLFYSGYGIYEAIKKKGKNYIDLMPKNRIGKTYFDFAFALILFLIVDIILGYHYSLSEVLLAFAAWTSIGNSAWYMFAIFILYIITYVSFKLLGNNKFIAICCVTVLSLFYVYIMSKVKEDYWSSTCLCYAAGMWYSYWKEKIETFLKKRECNYYLTTLIAVLLYGYLADSRYSRLMMYNMVSVIFCLVLILLSMKVSVDSNLLIWCGQNLFWLYILQRIPMLIFHNLKLNEVSPWGYLVVCVFFTVVLTCAVNKFTDKLKKRIWK